MSCVPNVASFSGLFVFALCLVYPKLPVFLDCLSSPYVLCTQCCQFIWIVCLRLMSWVPNVASLSGLFVFVLCLVYPMLPLRHKTKTNNPDKPATLGTQDIRRRQTIQRNWQHWVHKTYVASFSGLFVFALCLVYPMLPVSLDCLSSPYVLCTQCCRFLWIVCLRLMSCVPNVTNFSGLLVFVLCLVYPMLPVSLDCLSSPYVLCTKCCQFLWIVCLRLMSCVPNVASFSGLFVFALCLVYPMLPVSLDWLSSPYVLFTQCCQFLWIVFGTQDIRRRQTIQRNRQHWVHKT
jgi:hypothetical protein